MSREKTPERAPTRDEAVDAGARAWFDARQMERRDDARMNPKTGERWRWDDINELDQRAYRAFVRPIVVAAVAVMSGGGA